MSSGSMKVSVSNKETKVAFGEFVGRGRGVRVENVRGAVLVVNAPFRRVRQNLEGRVYFFEGFAGLRVAVFVGVVFYGELISRPSCSSS